MDKNKKCNECSEGCEKCTIESGIEKCDLCSIITHYMDSNGKWQKCNNAIEGCDYDKNNKVICIKCEKNYILKNGECKVCSIDNCEFCEYDNKEICLRCEGKNSMNMFGIEQYGLKNGRCEECDSESCGKCKFNQEKKWFGMWKLTFLYMIKKRNLEI